VDIIDWKLLYHIDLMNL